MAGPAWMLMLTCESPMSLSSAPPDTAGAVRVLVADASADILEALRLLLREAGFETECAGSVDDVRSRLRTRDYDLLLMDLNYTWGATSGREGLDLVADVRARLPQLPIVVMTGWRTAELAVEAVRRGARMCIEKPWDNAALTRAIACETARGRASRA